MKTGLNGRLVNGFNKLDSNSLARQFIIPGDNTPCMSQQPRCIGGPSPSARASELRQAAASEMDSGEENATCAARWRRSANERAVRRVGVQMRR